MKRQSVKDMNPVTVQADIKSTDKPLSVTVSVKGDPVDSVGNLNENVFKKGQSIYKVLAKLEEQVLHSFFEDHTLPVMVLIPLSPKSNADAIFELQEVIEGNIEGNYTIVYLYNSIVS